MLGKKVNGKEKNKYDGDEFFHRALAFDDYKYMNSFGYLVDRLIDSRDILKCRFVAYTLSQRAQKELFFLFAPFAFIFFAVFA